MAGDSTAKVSINLINIDLSGLGQFGEKLLSTTERAAVGLFAPMQIRREAFAQANAQRVLAESAADAVVSKEAGELRALELRQRAFARLVNQEVDRQANIERICSEAAKRPSKTVSPEPVAGEWIAAFFESCQDVSSAEMQILWGRLLANEVSKPGTVSKRLLNALRLMNQTDARDFQALCFEIFSTDPHSGKPSALFFCGDRSMNVSFGGVNIEGLVLVQLVKDEGRFVYDLSATRERFESEFFGRKVVFTQRPKKCHEDGKAPVIRQLTQMGRELANVVGPSTAQPLKEDLVRKFQERGITISLQP